jgi:hypothetical protein
MDNAFAEVPNDPEAIVALVKREAEEECLDDQLTPPVLDRCVRDAVAGLWASEIKTFVPLLALRRVRGCVRAGTCDGTDD